MKVLIVDDHALIREALHAVLKQLKREAVIFEASNSRQAMHIPSGMTHGHSPPVFHQKRH